MSFKIIFISVIVFNNIVCLAQSKSYDYPKTKIEDSVYYKYYRTAIKDPYQWLEKDKTKTVQDWVSDQNDFTRVYIDSIPLRETLKSKLLNLWDYEKQSIPLKHGAYTYFYKTKGLQNRSVWYRYKNNKEEAEVFLDPNTFSADNTTSLQETAFSKSAKYLVYAISEKGSDWRKLCIMDVASKTNVDDTIANVKFSKIAWKGDQGFYYSKYDRLAEKPFQKIYYHQIGTSQSEDELIFGKKYNKKYEYVKAHVTNDGKYLTLYAGNELLVKDLTKKKSKLKTLIEYSGNTEVVHSIDSVLYLKTYIGSDYGKLIKIDIDRPQQEFWEDVVPDIGFKIEDISTAGGFFFVKYITESSVTVIQYNLNGQSIRKVTLPGKGSVSGFNIMINKKETYYRYHDYINPPLIVGLNVKTGALRTYRKAAIDFNPDHFITKLVYYKSKDGTLIPMRITHQKDLKLTGKNPTILHAYGGFDISKTPKFSIGMALWLKLGGVYAVPNIRGGGEYGYQWHVNGMRLQKQNSFDDFVFAGKYLSDYNYTSSDYLAIKGASNGGLLIGAVMAQRPDLAKVALPAVGLFDMLRYHKLNDKWNEYGDAEESKKMFRFLKSYSPIHNIKDNVTYPATLILTGDHDDRVSPVHSYKFAATLQGIQNKANPILLRTEKNSGHGYGLSLFNVIEKYVDVFSFTLYQMGVKSLE
ncbi:prolyl oligopeptidase family serine peptidase [Aquimarina agarilytica]|uniref:prolyl oligopeptidase family serine peptidase n=1 Tax=Aquimarina agarilytica TaxID=1087449 RepID=UPI0002884B41|nr:prolyl oligopeptidase family serine peptidase [Aquimarina agarilytica]